MPKAGPINHLGDPMRVFRLDTLAVVAILLYAGCDTKSPKARARKMVSVMEKAQGDVFKEMEGAGLPRPPRSIDMLVGGDWGAAMDLKQAVESGFPPSCQIIYRNSLGSLKGMIGHYSQCLGSTLPDAVRGEVRGLVPPGLESEARLIHENLGVSQTRALKTSITILLQAYSQIKSLGPFESGSGDLPGDPRSRAITGGEGKDSDQPRLLSQKTNIDGLGTVWSYRLAMPPSSKYFAGSRDGSIWFGSSSGGGPMKVFRIKGAEVISSFVIPKDGYIAQMRANSRGIVVFGNTSYDAVTKTQGVAFLAQYDQSGKALWRNTFRWSMNDVISHLVTLDSGDVYMTCRELSKAEGPSVVAVDPEGKVNLVRLPAGTSTDGAAGLYVKDGSGYVVVSGSYGLYRITNGGLEFAMQAGYPFAYGNWIQPGDDGSFYLYDSYGKGGGSIIRLSASVKGDARFKLESPLLKDAPATSAYHVGTSGQAYVLTSKGIAILTPGTASARLIPFSEAMPQSTKMVEIGPGRFLVYWSNSDFNNDFTVIDLIEK